MIGRRFQVDFSFTVVQLVMCFLFEGRRVDRFVCLKINDLEDSICCIFGVLHNKSTLFGCKTKTESYNFYYVKNR